MHFKGGTPFEHFKAFRCGNKNLFDSMMKGLQQKAQPKSCELLIDMGCNQKCAHCFLGQTKIRKIMPFETVIQVGNALLENGYYIYPYPAEPLINSDSFAAYVKFLSHGADFLTNGSAFLAREPGKKMIKRFIENNVKFIRISLYGATEQTHEELTRTSGSFKSTLSTIEKIGQNIKQTISELTLTIVINKLNITELDDMVKIALQNNVKHVSILKIIPFYHCEFPEKMKMDKQATIDALLEISRLRMKYKGKLYIELGPSWGPNFHNSGIWKFLAHYTRQGEYRHFCFAIGWWIAVHPTKREIFPCMMTSGLPELKIGDLVGKSYKIKFNGLGEQLLKWHQEWSEKAKGCCAINACSFSEICHGGCRATALAKNLKKGSQFDWFTPFPDCQTQILEEIS